MTPAALLDQVVQRARTRHPDRPALIGVSGAQGSGKSYQCRAYAAAHPRVAHFSMDDIYLGKAEREERARLHGRHFGVRGPPGTHDLTLAGGLIARLGKPLQAALPRFDKAADDRASEHTWPGFQGPADAVLIDGWCLGAHPIGDIDSPINALEVEDSEGYWRKSVETALKGRYATFFAAFDAIIHLRAPNWEIVRRWRGEQEAETLGRALTPDDDARLDRFLMFYERITRSMLAGNNSAGWVVHLDEARNVVKVEERL